MDLEQPPRRNQGVGEGVDSRDAGEQQGNRTAEAPLRVLFVDDEAPIREVMRIELPRMGHEVTVCEDGETAVAVLAGSLVADLTVLLLDPRVDADV
mgnify:CR=1 FL=1